ncbi:MerR family transcriptional regulator [Clostridium felsineum]|uniref:MerR family transcriptional regulator n=1 Tax=Clostridium felsineum TaxID=36839 RepID=UPI00098C37A0|nr:MerR family transcriptional regulator [Clostridium felsineum]URZ16650.1 putative HTH-type transcriptional regulator [Clostridium felsineum DSM 794]
MYTMKQVCEITRLTYETLKFYCNEGLVPNVKRDNNNRRIFDDRDLAWIKDIACLKKCSMSIADIKEYLALCLEGKSSIPARQKMLNEKKEALLSQIEEINASIDYIDWKQNFYEDVISGKTEYVSNLI